MFKSALEYKASTCILSNLISNTALFITNAKWIDVKIASCLDSNVSCTGFVREGTINTLRGGLCPRGGTHQCLRF